MERFSYVCARLCLCSHSCNICHFSLLSEGASETDSADKYIQEEDLLCPAKELSMQQTTDIRPASGPTLGLYSQEE